MYIYPFIEFLAVFLICTVINVSFVLYTLTTLLFSHLRVFTYRMMGKSPKENKRKQY